MITAIESSVGGALCIGMAICSITLVSELEDHLTRL